MSTDLEALERVLTRLALTEDDKLQGILEKLLPLVIGKLDNAPQPVQQQVLKILGHVNTRLQALPAVQLPIDALVTLYASTTSPLVRNFALVYVERGAERATLEQRLHLVPALLNAVSSRSAGQQAILLRLAVSSMEFLANKTILPTQEEAETFAAKYAFLLHDSDRKIFLDFALRYLLYTPPTVRGPSSALQAANQQRQQQQDSNGQQSMHVDAPTAPPPPGLSFNDVAAIEGKGPFPDAATFQSRKLGVLNFTALAALAPSEALLLYLAAASDPNETVLRRGDELLKKRCAVDAARPPVDIEKPEVIEPLFMLFHGCLDDETVGPGNRRSPAGPALRSKLLNLFSKSVAAANSSPWAMMTVSSCLFGTGATPRVQQQGMEFAVWMFKHAVPATLAPVAPVIVENCLTLLDSSPAAAGQDTVATSLRSIAYQSIGQLAQRLPSVLRGRTDLAARCFAALATEQPGVRAAVAEATSSLAAVFEDRDETTDGELLQLLESSMSHHQDAVRGAAVQWAVRLFPFNHLQARYLCILGAADTRVQLASAAEEGLDPLKVAAKRGGRSGSSSTGISNGDTGNEVLSSSSGTSVDYPSLPKMLHYLRSRYGALKSPTEEGRRLALPAKSFLAAIKFLEECRKAHLDSGLQEADVGSYLVFLENALVREAPGELHSAALHDMLSVSATYRTSFTTAYASRPALFERLLGHVDAGARDAAGRLLGTLCSGMSAEQVQRLLDSLVKVVLSSASTEGKRPRYEDADGATAAVGYISAQLVTGAPLVALSMLEEALSALRKELESTAPEAALRATAAVALGCAGLPLSEPGAHALPALPDVVNLVAPMAAILNDKDPKVAKKGAQALGFLVYGHRDASVMESVVSALLEMRTCKVESVSFAIGESLCLAFGCVSVTADDMLHKPYTSLADLVADKEKTKEESKNIGAGVAAMELETEAGKPSGGATAEDLLQPRNEAESEIQRRILSALLEECVNHSRPEVRCCGAVWLVSLLLFCGGTSAVHATLARAQDALSTLLADESEITQEMSSRGLAAVYELADQETRAALVDSLVAVLSGGPGRKRTRAGDITGDTQMFESGTIGTVPGGGSLSTYKEICSLANDLGQPDLVYRFMQLANHQAAVNASRGAAFGFASVAKLAGDALAPHVAALVPRLYRSLYDPQPKVRDAMQHIWLALVDDPRAALTENFDPVAKALVKDMTGQQWRAREAAALAASDLIQGRRWTELKPHFVEFWTAAFRTMDDVKESVRQAGLTLVRCIRGLTLRLADKELTPVPDGSEAVAAALPLLLQLGLPSRVPEVQALAVDTIAKIVKAAGPELLRPHLAVVVPTLLESLSGLEDARLNYVEQHAERFGVNAGKLESARVAAAQGGAIGETLDSCARLIDGPTLVELAPSLSGLIRRGVGLNTRAGAGRFVTQVVRRLGSESAAATPQLMRALQEACAAERSMAVRRAYAAANAVLAQHAAGARVDKYVASWLENYAAEGADDSARAVAGLLLRSLARESPDIFSRYAADVAPVAYMAQYDSDSQVAAIWSDVWEESTTSVGAGLRLHAAAVLQQVQAGLKSGQWGRKKAAAEAAAKACVSGGDAVAPHALELMTALLAELPGRLWDGKEAVLSAIGSVATTCPEALKSADAELPKRVVGVLLEAAGKKKSVYRKEALVQMKNVIDVWGSEEDFLPVVGPPLLALAAEFASIQAATASTGGGSAAATDSSEKPAALPITEIMGCLGAVWAVATVQMENGVSWVKEGAATAANVLAAAGKLADQIAAMDAALRLTQRCAALAPDMADHKSPLEAADEAGYQKLLSTTVRIAEEGKSAAVREQAIKLIGSLFENSWSQLSQEDRLKWKGVMQEMVTREKVPAVKSAAARVLEILK